MNIVKANRGRIVSILFFGMIAILSLANCENEPDYDAMQEEYLEKKVEDFKDFQERNCQKRVLKEASVRADSFFLRLAKAKDFDSVQRPKSFARPRKPNVTVREDSLPLHPLIQNKEIDSLPVDSSKRE